jgi:hypothetical protein
MSDHRRPGISRRALLKVTGVAAAGAAALGNLPSVARAHDLRPTDPAYRFDEYEAIVNRDVAVRQLYQWPTITNPIIWPNIRNGLNGFQFSYGLAPDQIQVVVQAYASANAAMYDDFIWAKYRFGEARGVKDPATGEAATRNIFYPSKVPAVDAPPADRSHPYYADTSIEGAQRRGVLFLI